MKILYSLRIANLIMLAFMAMGVTVVRAQTNATPDHPEIIVRGRKYTPQSILQRNMGTQEDQTSPFPPHKVIGNIYYVGTRTLSSFLIVTSQGDILINSTYERNVPTIKQSVEQLGFKFSDVKILLGTHAHGDHQEGDALVKQLTGAQMMAMAEDVPALKAMRPGGKEHPIDKILHDGDQVTLGGTSLTAHLTAGHTPGCTTWTLKATEGAQSHDVVISCSLRAPTTLTVEVVSQFNRTFPIVRKLPCEVPLGDHTAQYDLYDKYDRLKPGAPNPFIDKVGCASEIDIEEAMFRALVAEQSK
jgi:metallo-beta-lactamase class B